MTPINKAKEGCVPVSSTCVVWEGPDLPCVDLCRGDSISDVIYKMAVKLCDLLTLLDITELDLECLDALCPKPQDIHDVIQLIITKVCAVNTIVNPPGGGVVVIDPNPQDPPPVDPQDRVGVSGECPDCEVTTAPCFQYIDKGGNTITTMDVTEYAMEMGLKVCELVGSISTMKSSLSNHEKRITSLEGAAEIVVPPQKVNSLCLLENPAGGVLVTDLLSAVEDKVCKLEASIGNDTALLKAVSAQCVGLDQAKALAIDANMSSLEGWTPQGLMRNLAQSHANIWVMLCDVRAAIITIKETCCDSGCKSVSIAMSASFNSATQVLSIFLTGNVPASFTDCGPAGSLVVITDGYGGVYQTFVLVKANMNSVVQIPLASTPLNTATDLSIDFKPCVYDQATKSQCQDCLGQIVRNTSSCPTLLSIPLSTSITYSFNNIIPNATYTVSLLNSFGILISAQTHSNVPVGPVTGVFIAPDVESGTSYLMQVTMLINGVSTTCQQNIVTTPSTPCSAPGSVSAANAL